MKENTWKGIYLAGNILELITTNIVITIITTVRIAYGFIIFKLSGFFSGFSIVSAFHRPNNPAQRKTLKAKKPNILNAAGNNSALGFARNRWNLYDCEILIINTTLPKAVKIYPIVR
jgi:hypothetical protein